MSRAGAATVVAGRVYKPAPTRFPQRETVILPIMTVRVLLFATYAELAGRTSVEVSVQSPATVSDVLCSLRAVLPGAGGLPERPLVAVNQVHARLDSTVSDGDELAVLPPLAGG